MSSPTTPSRTQGRRRQLNLRLDEEAVEVLEAVAFLEGKASIQEVVMPLVDEFVMARKQDSEVRAVLKQRTQYRGKGQEPLWADPTS